MSLCKSGREKSYFPFSLPRFTAKRNRKKQGKDKMEKEKKLYRCETKDCRFLFESEVELERCPDCGKKKIRLANVQA